MSTQHEEMLKRFREEFVKDTIMTNVKLVERQEPQELENFFIRERDLAVANREKEIVEMIDKIDFGLVTKGKAEVIDTLKYKLKKKLSLIPKNI